MTLVQFAVAAMAALLIIFLLAEIAHLEGRQLYWAAGMATVWGWFMLLWHAWWKAEHK